MHIKNVTFACAPLLLEQQELRTDEVYGSRNACRNDIAMARMTIA